ncbi:uncharacterized protein LOC133317720 [Gastrolobium bilobum]|uniref:uncharacterized protein LOC133317720 n=1 Tax=Gastrolobium bilobum TaxID=150636 RepID=UPI002AB115E7|nr:uncharacterized protein LOC133317720 [Gastrolobium bilobum]
MGLSSKQVSSRGLDWNQTLLQAQDLELPKPPPMRRQQQQTQQSEHLKCPRCDSTNTKFCYYNNYNKSQPRHFCRDCKRHWTKGGTLRNVPVGGGRKNKRVRKTTTPTSATTIATTSISTTTSNGNIDAELSSHMTIQTPLQRQSLSPLAMADQKSIPSSLYQSLIRPPSLLPQQNLMSTRDSEVSASLRCSNVYNYGEEFKIMEEPTINGIIPSTSGNNTHPWEIPATSTGMEMSNYWSWEDIDSLVSTDLNVPWDDSDIKP